MAQFWIKISGEGEFRDVSHGAVDENNPAPEGAEIIEASTFEDAMSLAELQASEALAEVILNDPQEDLEQEYKIWEMAVEARPADSDPRGLDYKTGLKTSLFAKLSFVKGELLSVQYFERYDGTEYTDLILDVQVTYNRNEAGVLTDRETVRKWTIEDGFGTHVKTTKKYYSTTQAAVADQRRRSNIVDNLVAKADPAVASFVKTMFRNLDNEINSYKSTGDTSLIKKISEYTGAWLDVIAIPASIAGVDVTLRQAIIGQLTLS